MRHIVWDFDGTLVDSRPLIEAGMEHALRGLGLAHRQDLREAWMQGVGLPVEEGLRRVFEPLGMDFREVLGVYRGFDWLGHEHLLQPFPGMRELVGELGGRGVPMGIATSKRRIPLLRQLEALGWAGCFDPIVTPDEVRRGKPDPESLHLILSRLGCPAQELLMIGDTPFDLDMARAAGVPALAVGHGFYDIDRLLPCHPRAYAPDVASLRELLLAWFPPAEALA